jgi:ElaB/YqjD/DUF883 family membrane-anchored ribosome-binding protein
VFAPPRAGQSLHMSNFIRKAKQLAGQHEKQVDEGLERVRDQVDKHTGHKYDKEFDKGVQAAEKHIHDRPDDS